MAVKDWMWLHIYNVENSEVHVMQLYNYRYTGRLPSPVGGNGKKFGMLRGKDFYVSGVSTSVFPGWFRMKMWIDRYVPPPDYVPPVFEQDFYAPDEPTPEENEPEPEEETEEPETPN
jgi:hypothetical protein